jgi:hypothetical protein
MMLKNCQNLFNYFNYFNVFAAMGNKIGRKFIVAIAISHLIEILWRGGSLDSCRRIILFPDYHVHIALFTVRYTACTSFNFHGSR